MKFLYEYQDKANRRHSGVLSAANKETAYAELKKKGIKPIRCEGAPGLFNAIFGKGKRWMAIAVLAVVLVSFAVLYVRSSKMLYSVKSSQAYQVVQAIGTGDARRQIIGNALVIEKGIRTGWADFFKDGGDRFLASFAIPGVKAAFQSATEAEIERVLAVDAETDRWDLSDDSLEGRQIRSIVSGMKIELRRFLKSGGTIAEYGQRLVERQEREIRYYNFAKDEIRRACMEGRSEAEVAEIWERNNVKLSKMGIRAVPFPEE